MNKVQQWYGKYPAVFDRLIERLEEHENDTGEIKFHYAFADSISGKEQTYIVLGMDQKHGREIAIMIDVPHIGGIYLPLTERHTEALAEFTKEKEKYEWGIRHISVSPIELIGYEIVLTRASDLLVRKVIA